jgi:LysM repeat protein
MKSIVLLPLAAALALASAGCVTTQEPAGPPPASQADVGYLREEIRRLSARLDASDAELGRVQGDVVASRSAQPGYASAAQVQAMQKQLDDLQRQIRALDTARVQDKKEIYDDISKKVASLIAASRPPAAPAGRSGSRSGSQSGYEHVVQPGESLSKIAAAYNVRMNVIVEANNLKSADQIHVGQKLFIPD